MLIPVASRICDMEQTLESYILNASFILDLSLGVTAKHFLKNCLRYVGASTYAKVFDPVGVAKPIIGAWPGDRWERWRAEGLICKLEFRIIMGIDITTVEALIPTHDFLYKLIEKVTKTAVFGLDKIQERLGTNNQF